MRHAILALAALIGLGLGVSPPAEAETITVAFTGLDVEVLYDELADLTFILTPDGPDLLDTLSLRVDNVLAYASILTDEIDVFLVAPGPLPAFSGAFGSGIFDLFLNGLGLFLLSDVLDVPLFHDARTLTGIDGLAVVFDTNIVGVLDPVTISFSSSIVPTGPSFRAVLSGEMTFVVIPEPGSVLLAGLGFAVVGFGLIRSRRRRTLRLA